MTDATWVCAGVVRVARFFFCLTDPDPPPRWHWQANARDNGLVGATEGAMLVRTGCGGGWVNLTVELHPRPPAAETAGWDDAVEISYRTALGQSYVRSARGGGSDFPRVSFRGAGSYRIRVHARGRQPGAGRPGTDRPEDYLLQVWPSPAGRTEILLAAGDEPELGPEGRVGGPAARTGLDCATERPAARPAMSLARSARPAPLPWGGE